MDSISSAPLGGIAIIIKRLAWCCCSVKRGGKSTPIQPTQQTLGTCADVQPFNLCKETPQRGDNHCSTIVHGSVSSHHGSLWLHVCTWTINGVSKGDWVDLASVLVGRAATVGAGSETGRPTRRALSCAAVCKLIGQQRCNATCMGLQAAGA